MRDIIFVVEDDESIRELLKYSLDTFGFNSICFETAEEMFEALEKQKPDLLLLDIMLPGMDGISALRKIKGNKNYSNLPTILLTAKSGEVEKVTGLDIGADDYITKPFGVLELSARVRAVLRRQNKNKEVTVIEHGDIKVDFQSHVVTVCQSEIFLTNKEFDLLITLCKNPDKAFSREELLKVIWNTEFAGESRTLDMHIMTLRQKLCSSDPLKYIQTVRGIGYKIYRIDKQ